MKKKWWAFAMIFVLLLTKPAIGLAEEGQSFENEGVVGFYGTYEPPKDETSTDSKEEPGTSTKSQPDSSNEGKEGTIVKETVKNTSTGTNTNGANQADAKNLPKTGEKGSNQIKMVGIAVILLILLIFVKKRRRP